MQDTFGAITWPENNCQSFLKGTYSNYQPLKPCGCTPTRNVAEGEEGYEGITCAVVQRADSSPAHLCVRGLEGLICEQQVPPANCLVALKFRWTTYRGTMCSLWGGIAIKVGLLQSSRFSFFFFKVLKSSLIYVQGQVFRAWLFYSGEFLGTNLVSVK